MVCIDLCHTVGDQVDESISYIKHILHEMGFLHTQKPLCCHNQLYSNIWDRFFFKEAQFTFQNIKI